MKQKKENRIALLLQWAGEQKIWLLLAILLAMASGLCIIVPYIGIYRLMDAAFQHICTKELVVQTVMMISVSVALRFVLFGCSGVAAHKGCTSGYGSCLHDFHYPDRNGSSRIYRCRSGESSE